MLALTSNELRVTQKHLNVYLVFMQLTPRVAFEPLCRQSRHCAHGKQCSGNLAEDLVSESRMLHPRGQQILTSEHNTCCDNESFGSAFCQGNHWFHRYCSFLLDCVSFVCGAHVKIVKEEPFQQGRNLLYYRLYKYMFPLFEIKYLVSPLLDQNCVSSPNCIVQKVATFYANPASITMCTTACFQIMPCATSAQFPFPRPIYEICNLERS
jgi:hypothetical protein